MISTESVLESGDQPCIRLEPLINTHLPEKATPTVSVDGGSTVTANGVVHDIEDRILRITGYYGYNPGYSSHRSECRENKVHCGLIGGCDNVTPSFPCKVCDAVNERPHVRMLCNK